MSRPIRTLQAGDVLVDFDHVRPACPTPYVGVVLAVDGDGLGIHLVWLDGTCTRRRWTRHQDFLWEHVRIIRGKEELP